MGRLHHGQKQSSKQPQPRSRTLSHALNEHVPLGGSQSREATTSDQQRAELEDPEEGPNTPALEPRHAGQDQTDLASDVTLIGRLGEPQTFGHRRSHQAFEDTTFCRPEGKWF